MELVAHVRNNEEFVATLSSIIDGMAFRWALLAVFDALSQVDSTLTIDPVVECEIIRTLHASASPHEHRLITALEHRALLIREECGINVLPSMHRK
jgi:hypothetical protein